MPACGTLAVAPDYFIPMFGKSVQALQAKGITVILTFLNNHDAAGWSEFKTEADAQAFAEQLNYVVETYGFDGIDIDDEYSNGVAQDGTLAMVTQMMRALMPSKIISKALWADTQNFGPTYKGVGLAQTLTYGWYMGYGGEPSVSLPDYAGFGMTTAALGMGGRLCGSNNSINGTPEFAYGLTDWWELGLYLPFAIKDEKFYSNAFKLRTLFVSPHADQRDFFYGVNFEFSNETPPFAQTRFAMEIRPIIGIRNSEYEFIVNPIVDVGFGKYGEQHFAPAARVARKFDQDLYAGFEYYSDFGQIGRFGRFSDQEHTLFAVTDFKLGVIDVNFGVGYGLTPVSDRWVIKTILGYAFPVPSSNASGGDRALTGLVNPMSHAQARILQP